MFLKFDLWRRLGVLIRELDLISGGLGFPSLSPDGFVFGGPEFNSSTSCK